MKHLQNVKSAQADKKPWNVAFDSVSTEFTFSQEVFELHELRWKIAPLDLLANNCTGSKITYDQ